MSHQFEPVALYIRTHVDSNGAPGHEDADGSFVRLQLTEAVLNRWKATLAGCERLELSSARLRIPAVWAPFPVGMVDADSWRIELFPPLNSFRIISLHPSPGLLINLSCCVDFSSLETALRQGYGFNGEDHPDADALCWYAGCLFCDFELRNCDDLKESVREEVPDIDAVERQLTMQRVLKSRATKTPASTTLAEPTVGEYAIARSPRRSV